MEKYVKIKISLKDKLNLLLFDLFPEKIYNRLNEKKVINLVKKLEKNPDFQVDGDINIEEEEKINFFDHINEDVKTNF